MTHNFIIFFYISDPTGKWVSLHHGCLCCYLEWKYTKIQISTFGHISTQWHNHKNKKKSMTVRVKLSFLPSLWPNFNIRFKIMYYWIPIITETKYRSTKIALNKSAMTCITNYYEHAIGQLLFVPNTASIHSE